MWKIGSGTASVARAFSANLDGLLDNKMSDAFAEYLPMGVRFFSPYPDMLAFSITIFMAGELCRVPTESHLNPCAQQVLFVLEHHRLAELYCEFYFFVSQLF